MRIAVVTGSNKGIGYAIVKGLCANFDGVVYLTARDANRGEEAVKKLNELGYNPKFHLLDIDNVESIRKFRDHIKEQYGGLDILVNNAAIAYKMNATEPFGEQAENTIKINYFGVLATCELLFPLLRPHARVVNVSSSAGHLHRIPGENLRKQFSHPDLTISQLSDLMKQFVEAAKQGTQAQLGWGNSAYSVSKVGLSALTIIQQKTFNSDPREDIVVNSVHPGYVATDMSSYKGPLTIEQGAEAPVYLALLPPNVTSPCGSYVWYDKKIVNWTDGPTP